MQPNIGRKRAGREAVKGRQAGGGAYLVGHQTTFEDSSGQAPAMRAIGLRRLLSRSAGSRKLVSAHGGTAFSTGERPNAARYGRHVGLPNRAAWGCCCLQWLWRILSRQQPLYLGWSSCRHPGRRALTTPAGWQSLPMTDVEGKLECGHARLGVRDRRLLPERYEGSPSIAESSPSFGRPS
jgi:hypothetical protein